MSLGDDLQTLGFSELEARTYEILVAFGFRTPGQVAAYLDGVHLQEVTDALKVLEEKGYVKSIATRGEESRIYIPEAPKIVLGADVSNRLATRLGEIGNKVNDIWHTGESQLLAFKDEFQRSKAEAVEGFTSQIDEVTKSEKEQFDKLADSEKSAMEELSANLGKNVKAAIIPPIQDVADTINNQIQSLSATKDETVQKINEAISTHHASLDQVTSETKTEILDYSNELGMSVSARVTVVDQAVAQMADQSKAQVEEKRTLFTNKIEESANHASSQIDSFGSDHLTSMDDQFKIYQKSIIEKYDNTKSVVNETTTEIKKASGEAEKQAISVTQESVKGLQNSIQDQVNSIKAGLVKAIEDTQTSAIEGLTKILDQTKSELGNAHQTIEQSLRSNKSTLDKDLDDLNLQMQENLKEKFGEVQQNNISFRDELVQASNNSVEHITNELTSLQNFISQFLVDTKDELKAALDKINSDIDATLGSIENEATAQREGFVNEAKSKAEKLASIAEERLEQFQTTISNYLNSFKEEVIQSLNSGVNQFEQAISDDFSSFEDQRKTLLERQQQQIEQFNSEAEKLQIDATGAKEKLISSFSHTAREVKDSSLSKFTEISSSSLETFKSDLENLKKKTQEDISKFKSDFELNIVTIREELPQEIETMFSDHSDQLSNLIREFELYKSKSEKLLKDLEKALEDNTKGMFGKKDFVIQKLEEHRRVKSDYVKMSKNLEDMLLRATKDTEETQQVVLRSLGQTVQDEVEKVENLVSSQTTQIQTAIESLSLSVDKSHSSFMTNVTSTSEELLNEMEDKIKNELATTFSEPLSSLIGKAQYLATGVDSNSQENVILKTQEELLSSLKNDFESLLTKVKEDVGTISSKVVEQVTSSITESEEMKSEFVNSNRENLDQQFKVMEGFSQNMGSALHDVISRTKDELRTQSNSTIESLEQTVKTRIEEIETGVQAETNNLKEDTQKRLDEISEKFDSFNSNLDIIRKDTNERLSSTLENAKKVQEENLNSTLGSLKESFAKAENAIDSSANTMNENVSKPLLDIKKSAEELDKNFANLTKKVADKAANEVKAIFKEPLSNVETILQATQTSLEEFNTFVQNVEEIRKQLVETLENKLNGFRDSISTFNEETKQIMLKEINSQVDDLVSFVDNVYSFVNTQIMDLQTEVNGAVSNVQGTVENLILNAIEQIKNNVSNIAGNLQAKIAEITDQGVSNLQGIEENLRNGTKSYEAIVDESLGKDMGAMNDRFRSHIEEVKSQLDKTSELLKSEVKGSETTLTQKIESEIQKGREEITTTISKIPEVISETLDAAGKAMNLLRQIAEGAKAFDPKMVETTYIDATKEALISDLNALIMRTKSNLTIVTPTIDWVDSRVWEEYGRKSVTIITDPTAHSPKDQDVMEKMRKSDNNIQFRKYQAKGFGAESLKMIIATRDGEEVLIGLPVTNKEVYGIVTQDPILVEELGTLVSSYRAMPRW